MVYEPAKTIEHNKELEGLYKKAKEDILDKVAEYNKSQKDEAYHATSPLFLKSYEDYESAEIKVMVFGQETNGWYQQEEIGQEYVDFFISGYCYKPYRSHFWKGIEQFLNLLQEKNANKKIGHLWNNIVKMGYQGRGKNFPEMFYDSIVKPHLNNLIPKEIEILKPDYIIFLTGPRYDWILNDVFGTPERKIVEGFSNGQLCEVIIPNVKKSFRTYHPNYFIKAKKQADRDKIFNRIVEEMMNLRGEVL